MTFHQQGDCLLKPNAIPKKAKDTGSLSLIRSQVTQNEHAVTLPAKVLKDGETLYVFSETDFELTHSDPKEGHLTLKIPAGSYLVDQPLEYDHFAEEARAVAD